MQGTHCLFLNYIATNVTVSFLHLYPEDANEFFVLSGYTIHYDHPVIAEILRQNSESSKYCKIEIKSYKRSEASKNKGTNAIKNTAVLFCSSSCAGYAQVL